MLRFIGFITGVISFFLFFKFIKNPLSQEEEDYGYSYGDSMYKDDYNVESSDDKADLDGNDENDGKDESWSSMVH